MSIWKLTPLALSISLLTACGGGSGNSSTEGIVEPIVNEGRAIDLTILHMNDHHSHVRSDDFDFDVSDLSLEATLESGDPVQEVEVTYGGFPLLTQQFKSLTADNTHVLKLHSGDAITGTLYYSLFKGAADAAVMNEICFDAFALGNHEFDDGDTGLVNFLDELDRGDCQTPVLAANVVPSDSSPLANGYIEPYTIVEFDGEQVGIVGIDIAGKTQVSSNPDAGTEFLDETTTAQAQIDALSDMGINKIILMTHYQYANDLTLAAALDGVDVIVGGDSHTLLGDDTFSELGFNPSGDYPTLATDAAGKTVCVVQAWEYAHILGKLDVSFDANGDVTACSGMPIMPIDGENFVYEYADDDDRVLGANDQLTVMEALTAHPELMVATADINTENLLADFDAQVDELKQQVIGSSADDLCLERFPGQGRSTICDRSQTYLRGSDISNIVAKAFLTVTQTADIAIQNGGGVRVDVAAGDLTIADAFTLLPFSNTLVTLEMSGQQIVDVLEDALANTLDNEGSSGSYPYASGLRYSIDASQDQGRRISNVEINSRLAGSWSSIDLEATYTVVTNDFIASGRDGYSTFGAVFNAGDYEDTFTEYAQGFIEYVEALTAEGRQLQKLPESEYSTQSYIDASGCDHSAQVNC